MAEHVKVHVSDDSPLWGDWEIWEDYSGESLWAIEQEPGIAVIDNLPAMTRGLSWGDSVSWRMADGVREIEDVVADGGYLQVAAIIDGPDVDAEQSETVSGLLRAVRGLGEAGDVRTERCMGGLVSIAFQASRWELVVALLEAHPEVVTWRWTKGG